jgi:anti-sigma B factor antagonist
MTAFNRLDVREVGDVAVAQLRDRQILDRRQIMELGEELYKLAEKDQAKILLDFSSVVFLSSEVLGKLISMQRKVKLRKGTMKLCNLSPNILEIFTLCNLDLIFDIKTDMSKSWMVSKAFKK